jgi:hypothetical protein
VYICLLHGGPGERHSVQGVFTASCVRAHSRYAFVVVSVVVVAVFVVFFSFSFSFSFSYSLLYFFVVLALYVPVGCANH